MVGSINPLASSLNIQSTSAATASKATDSTTVSDAGATATDPNSEGGGFNREVHRLTDQG